MEHFYVRASGHMTERLYPGRIGFEVLQCAHFYDGAERHHRGAIKVEFGHGNDPLASSPAGNLWGRALAEYECREFGHLVGLSAETEHLPHAESRVTLDPEVHDLFGDGVPHIHFHLGEVEARTRTRAAQVLAMLLDAAGAKDINVDTRPHWASHQIGTCRMSDDPEQGVVDRNLRVFGTRNLYAVGSSNFPTGGALQPTLTIAALSLRLADLLSARSASASPGE